MDSFPRFQRFKKLGQGLRKSLPIITPWLLVPMGFEVSAAFLRGCPENSLEDVLLFYHIFRPNKNAPSSVAAILTTMAGTYFFRIASATSQFYKVTFTVLRVSLVFMFWRSVDTWKISLASIPHYQDRSYNDKLQMAAPRTGQYNSARLVASSTAFAEGKPLLRLKHCRYCNVQVERYDRPAIYNCVGRKNHVLFLVMMVNFIIVEALYVGASEVYLDCGIENWTWSKAVDEKYFRGWIRPMSTCRVALLMVMKLVYEAVSNVLNFSTLGLCVVWIIMGKTLRRKPWVLCTALFAFVHILWQVPFLGFHIYCACVNLTTDEMFHWEDYINLHVETPPEPGRPHGGKEFFNPY